MTSIENISNPGIPKAPESLPAGYAKIKPEFVVLRPHIADPSGVEEPANDTGNEQSSFKDLDPALNSGADEPPKKKLRLSGAEKRKLAREEGKKKRGMNTNRKFALMKDDVQLCWKAAVGEQCPLQEKCYYSHEVSKYLETKPRDIHFPSPSALSSDPPFVLSSGSKSDGLGINSIDPTASCPVYLRTGVCPQGFKCRFLGNHIKRDDDSIDEPGWKLIMDESLAAGAKEDCEGNNIGISVIKQVRTRKYPTPLADRYIAETQQDKEVQDGHDMSVDMNINTTRPGTLPEMAINQLPEECQKETPDVPMRPQEKKRLHWKGLLYLAPLTTVGNLPFRRLCVDYGAQITCSEMAVATSLLSGSREEWSLVRRLPSERAFGIQVAGSKIAPLTQIAEIFRSEFGLGAEGRGTGVDFVDVNCGCPIDLVFKSGAGSALLDTPTKLGKILTGMNRCLGDIPLTVKLRTGVKDGRNTAHKMMPKLKQWGVSAVTIHGRTRQQRYTKLADWSYIKSCVEALRDSTEEEDMPPIPLFGGGDVYTQQGYWEQLEQTGVDGIMIGRGALIKPWIFTEIQERRDWDISSRERLDMIRKYADYGLNHWGSDTLGVNTTRRFLCEALSFQYRYIPLGILESVPRINDRPPLFRGRDDLETLLASGDSRDWVKISEMFLGRAPEGWTFTPKHKSNSYDPEEANG